MKTHQRIAIVLLLIALLSACKPSNSSIDTAIRNNWPYEQARFASSAAFERDVARKFQEGAKMAAGIANNLNVPNNIGPSQQAAADTAKINADNHLWHSTAKIEKITNIRCAPAKNLPGYNCEAMLTLKGSDGRSVETPCGYRFDTVDGKTAIVGPINN